MSTILARWRGRARDERGAGLVEYALLVALIAVVCISAVTFVGTSGSGKFDKAGEGLGGAGADVTTTTAAPQVLPPSSYTTQGSCVAAGHVWIMGRCYWRTGG